MKEMGYRLKELRGKLGLSQIEVAARLGLTNKTVSAYESGGAFPSLRVLRELVVLYGTTADYILGFEHKEMINLSGLEERQKSIMYTLLDEFQEN